MAEIWQNVSATESEDSSPESLVMESPTSNASDAKGQKQRSPEAATSLGPGLHLGVLEIASQTYVVRLMDGRRIRARVAPQVHRSLIDECLQHQRPMVLVEGTHGPEIVGALQTGPSFAPDVDGNVAIHAKSLRLEASETVRVNAGSTELQINSDGKLRLRAHRTVIDSAAYVRIYSALVELP